MTTWDEPLPNPLPGVGNPLHVLVVDDPVPVNEHVALLEHNLER